MGAVACERHGTHAGLLSCGHVHEAVASSVALGPFSICRFDLSGHGREALEHIICADCVAKFDLSPAELIPENVWADDYKFPLVYPLCAACFLEWRNGVQNEPVPSA